jgi:hypothetical protein
MATITSYPIQLQFNPRKVLDVENQGTGRISGTVAIKGTPTNTLVARRVVLIRQQDGLRVAETMSAAITGVYNFYNVHRGYIYDVVSYDDITANRAVIADGVSAV